MPDPFKELDKMIMDLRCDRRSTRGEMIRRLEDIRETFDRELSTADLVIDDLKKKSNKGVCKIGQDIPSP